MAPPPHAPARPRRRAATCSSTKRRGPRQGTAPHFGQGRLAQLPSAMSVMTWVKAPSGSAVITGSEPPASSVSTVRW